MTNMHHNVPFKLGKEEVKTCKALFDQIRAEEDGARKLLDANFENSEQIYEEITRGADEFYTLCAQDVTSDIIRQKLSAAIAGMSPAAQYRYLTNVLVAMSYTGSTLYNNDAWMDHIEDCKTILRAMDAGMMDENHPEIGRKVVQLMNLASSHIESSAVLLLGQPHYKQLMDACLVSNPDELEMLAMDTREGSIAMAATIYTLSTKGHLPSLNPAAHTPYSMGVMSAYLLNVDALQKNAVWEFIKPRLITASRAALTLLVGFGNVTISAVPGVFAFLAMAILTESLVLSAIIGGMVGLPIILSNAKHIKADTQTLIDAGAKVVTYTTATVTTAYRHLRNWIENEVLPVMWPKWQEASKFVREHVIKPAAELIGKIRTRAVDGYATAKEKLGTFTSEVYNAANRVAPQANYTAPQANAVVDKPVEAPAVQQQQPVYINTNAAPIITV